MKQFFRYLLILLFSLFLLAGAVLQTGLVREFAREWMIDTLERETGYTVEISDVKLFPTFQLMLQGLKVFDQDKMILSIENLHTGFYPLDLRHDYLHIHTLTLEGVKVSIGNKSQAGASLFSLKELPLKINVDSLEVDDIAIMENDETKKTPSVAINGGFYMDPKEDLIVSILKFRPLSNLEYWLETEVGYDHGVGSFQIKTEDNIELHAEFLATSDKLFRVSRFHASYESYSIDGTATITYDGHFEDSDIIFSSGELSDKLSVNGFLYGDGKILGSLWSPKLDFKVFSDHLVAKDISVRDVKARISSVETKKGLVGEVSLSFIKDEAPFEFSGKMFWDESLGPLPTRFYARTNLTKITHLLALDTTDISGDVELEFMFKEDNVYLNAALHDGQLESYTMGSLIFDIEGILTGDLNGLEIRSLTAKDRENGSYSANGYIKLDYKDKFPFELDFSLSEAAIYQLDDLKGKFSGNLVISGNVEQAAMEGELTLNYGRMTIANTTNQVAESIHVIYVNQPQGEELPTPSWIKAPEVPITVNVKMVVPGDAKIKGDDFTSEWSGEVLITGTPMAPEYFGELKIKNGKYTVRGRNLKFDKGTMTFAGDLNKKTSVYIIGEMEIDRYKIEVIVKGPIKNTSISFHSNPPLSRKEILSWVLFHKDISDISEFQGGQLNQSISTLSTGGSEGPDILTRFQQAIGVDRIGISGGPEGAGGKMSFEVGKYVSENTYISLSRKPVREFNSKRIGTTALDEDQFDQSNRIGIETSVGKYFKLQAEVDEDQVGQINLIWKRDY